MADGFVQTNVNLTEEDSKVLDQMMVEDAYDNRSAFVRRLIRLEWQRRKMAAAKAVEATPEMGGATLEMGGATPTRDGAISVIIPDRS